jgi:hypothetical protein
MVENPRENVRGGGGIELRVKIRFCRNVEGVCYTSSGKRFLSPKRKGFRGSGRSCGAEGNFWRQDSIAA